MLRHVLMRCTIVRVRARRASALAGALADVAVTRAPRLRPFDGSISRRAYGLPLARGLLVVGMAGAAAKRGLRRQRGPCQPCTCVLSWSCVLHERFPLLVVKAVPASELAGGAARPRVDWVIHNARGALLAAAVRIFHAACFVGAVEPPIHVRPVDGEAIVCAKGRRGRLGRRFCGPFSWIARDVDELAVPCSDCVRHVHNGEVGGACSVDAPDGHDLVDPHGVLLLGHARIDLDAVWVQPPAHTPGR